jgi:uncharacterized surface protein with fasciclin (FAS1) repeats
VAATFVATLTACNSSSTDSETRDTTTNDSTSRSSEEMVMGEGVEVGGAMMVPSKNIVENAVSSSDHTTLVAAATQAGLAETLSGTGPFTVFAQTNIAFGAVS